MVCKCNSQVFKMDLRVCGMEVFLDVPSYCDARLAMKVDRL